MNKLKVVHYNTDRQTGVVHRVLADPLLQTLHLRYSGNSLTPGMSQRRRRSLPVLVPLATGDWAYPRQGLFS